ncbi:hypothetical protein C0995_009234 [Termitomyces sp. Mi166|nr:hypothetical protein C0995_009234 [Termitomyces sp. Mi166\
MLGEWCELVEDDIPATVNGVLCMVVERKEGLRKRGWRIATKKFILLLIVFSTPWHSELGPLMDETIVKRLHISGLTPALTSDDILRRLSTFGTVKAVDGFGLPNGPGQPRKFGYVTLETTQGKLSRCLNLLSGSTWKGAKLRIGEAKPDFAERLAAEREAASLEPPKKKQRRYGGVEAADMSLVTPENVATRGAWTVTPLGRTLRPMRMRPSRPLPPPKEDKVLSKGKAGKVKKKVREPDTRARRRMIDMTRYGSVHLKGMFLDMEMTDVGREEERKKGPEVEDDSDESEAEASQEEEEADVAAGEAVEEAGKTVTLKVIESTPPPAPPPLVNTSVVADNNTDIAAEKKQTLDLLTSLFGNKDDGDWVGRESVDSDVDETNIAKRHRMVVDANDDGDFEVVPMNVDDTPVSLQKHNEKETPVEPIEVETEALVPQPSTEKKQQAIKLKDLFAPREEDAGFSLLGHLDLDLELDDEIPFAITETEPSHPQEPTHSTTAPSIPVPTYVAPQLNPKLPLFFPHASSAGSSTKARPKDILEVALENKWHWRDPAVEFYRTGTEEDIRKRWEESKVELTREWKRRWREAGKISRRRRIGDTGDN